MKQNDASIYGRIKVFSKIPTSSEVLDRRYSKHLGTRRNLPSFGINTHT